MLRTEELSWFADAIDKFSANLESVQTGDHHVWNFAVSPEYSYEAFQCVQILRRIRTASNESIRADPDLQGAAEDVRFAIKHSKRGYAQQFYCL